MRRFVGAGVAAVLIGVALSFWWTVQQSTPLQEGAATSTSQESKDPTRLLRVAFLRGEVSLHRPSTGSFELINEGDVVGFEARVRTFDNTFVVLKRPESSERLELGANTEVFVDRWDQARQVYFARGELFLSASGERGQYRIETPDFEITTENADFLMTQEGPNASLEVSGGVLQLVRRRDGAKLTLEKGEWANLPKRSALVKREFPFQVVTPLQNEHLFLSDGAREVPVRFAWRGVPDEFKTELQVGSAPDQLKTVDFAVTGRPGEATLSLPEGIHFWRMVHSEPSLKRGRKVQRGRLLETPIHRILVLREAPVQLKAPRGKISPAQVRVFSGVNFSWSNPSRLERLILEVASDELFANIISRQPVVDVGEHVLKLPRPGVYFWRVSGFRRGSSEFIVSAPQSFEWMEQDLPPQILNPRENELITIRALEDRRAPLIWKSDLMTLKTVKIFDRSNLDKPRLETVLAQEQPWPIPGLPKGKYRLVLQSEGGLSSSVDFEVVSAPVLPWKSDADQGPLQARQLEWQEGPRGTEMYRLRLWPLFSVNPDQSTEVVLVDEARWQVPLDFGELMMVVVQALGKDGEIKAESTERMVWRQSD